MTWRFLNSGAGPGKLNMEIDEGLALALLRDEGFPSIRVYGWKPWTLSLGWNQSPEDVLLDRAEADGIDVVRRPTGGRAVLHANELTYAVVMKADGKNVREVHRMISEGLLCAVQRLGVEAAMEERGSGLPGGAFRSGACFVAAARSEIVVAGRKLVGSAQRRYGAPGRESVVLQHGSLLLGDDHIRIVDYLRMPGGTRDALRRELRRRSTNLSAELGRRVTFEEAAAAVKEGFEKAWDVRLGFVAIVSELEHETTAN
ncbi:MAG: octanoyltransferase LipM [Bacteroidia bacterium]|nr:MAG: octanoyltransferase LipM [Bacteroidia bacterium]